MMQVTFLEGVRMLAEGECEELVSDEGAAIGINDLGVLSICAYPSSYLAPWTANGVKPRTEEREIVRWAAVDEDGEAFCILADEEQIRQHWPNSQIIPLRGTATIEVPRKERKRVKLTDLAWEGKEAIPADAELYAEWNE